MRSNDRKLHINHRVIETVLIVFASFVLIYLLIAIYFGGHFYFNTVINGANVSLKAHKEVGTTMRDYLKDYRIQLIERNDKNEIILGQRLEIKYNENNSISNIYVKQKPFQWIKSIFQGQSYYFKDIYSYNKKTLLVVLNDLNCMKGNIIEPQNVSFRYSEGTYVVLDEVLGNRINKDKLRGAVEQCLLNGVTELNLEKEHCYENPRYTKGSVKALTTLKLLNHYVSTNITYQFGSKNEILDGEIISEWLSVDENLEVVMNKVAVIQYVKSLGKKYDTVGITRKFKTSTGKVVEVKGGLFGWKINREAESLALLENITQGDKIIKEPIYAQKAFTRDENELGTTYIEINITKQHVWFYLDGKLKTQGSVVTGDPGKGNATVLGTYMLNYKQKDAILAGPGYEVKVTYWMPFYGNMGLHDAYWRYSFGGEIYKRNGTHGCVNAPYYLAKTIYENVEEGTPVICYEEKKENILQP